MGASRYDTHTPHIGKTMWSIHEIPIPKVSSSNLRSPVREDKTTYLAFEERERAVLKSQPCPGFSGDGDPEGDKA